MSGAELDVLLFDSDDETEWLNDKDRKARSFARGPARRHLSASTHSNRQPLAKGDNGMGLFWNGCSCCSGVGTAGPMVLYDDGKAWPGPLKRHVQPGPHTTTYGSLTGGPRVLLKLSQYNSEQTPHKFGKGLLRFYFEQPLEAHFGGVGEQEGEGWCRTPLGPDSHVWVWVPEYRLSNHLHVVYYEYENPEDGLSDWQILQKQLTQPCADSTQNLVDLVDGKESEFALLFQSPMWLPHAHIAEELPPPEHLRQMEKHTKPKNRDDKNTGDSSEEDEDSDGFDGNQLGRNLGRNAQRATGLVLHFKKLTYDDNRELVSIRRHEGQAKWNQLMKRLIARKTGQVSLWGTNKHLKLYKTKLRNWLVKQHQADMGLPPWQMTCQYYGGRHSLPLWAFLLEYAHPTPRVQGVWYYHDCHRETVLSLQRLVHTAQFQGGHPQRPELCNVDDLANIFADALTVIPLCTTYMTDQIVFQPQEEVHDLTRRSVECDQWAHTLCCPLPGETAYDCEDGAATAYYVARLIQTTALQDVNTSMIGAVQHVSWAYVPFMAIGSLRLPGNTRTYHAWVVLADVRLVDETFSAAGLCEKGALLKALVPAGHKFPNDRKHLPTLFVESTEATAAQKEPYLSVAEPYTGDEYMTARFADPHTHCRIPQETMNKVSRYEHVIQLVCPHLWTHIGVADVFCLDGSGKLGAEASAVRGFGTSGWKPVVPIKVTNREYQSARWAMSRRPRSIGLPRCNPIYYAQGLEGVVPTRFPWSQYPKQHRILIWCSSNYAPHVVDALRRHCKLTKKQVSTWHGANSIEILHGLSVSYFLIELKPNKSLAAVPFELQEGPYGGGHHLPEPSSSGGGDSKAEEEEPDPEQGPVTGKYGTYKSQGEVVWRDKWDHREHAQEHGVRALHEYHAQYATGSSGDTHPELARYSGPGYVDHPRLRKNATLHPGTRLWRELVGDLVDSGVDPSDLMRRATFGLYDTEELLHQTPV